MNQELDIPAVLQFRGEYEQFSNFYPSIILFENRNYPTVEHAFQAAKTKDEIFRKKISEIPAYKPGQAKRMGRKSRLRKDWELIKLSIMRRLLMQKFSFEEFKNLLTSTKDAIIIEGNYWHDNYWGDCYCSKCEEIPGKNHLGKLLMKIRDIIK